MMITLALLLAIQGFGVDDPYGLRASGEAHKKWLDCTFKQVDQLAAEPESARDIATAALSRCDLEESVYRSTLMKMFTARGQGTRGLDEAIRQTRDLRARMEDSLVDYTITVRNTARRLTAKQAPKEE